LSRRRLSSLPILTAAEWLRHPLTIRRPALDITSGQDVYMKINELTVNDDAMLKSRFTGITYQEEDINVADESYLARPPLLVDENIPWMDVARC
jgi:hypothetical protein